jgi:hypothetical protein
VLSWFVLVCMGLGWYWVGLVSSCVVWCWIVGKVPTYLNVHVGTRTHVYTLPA